MADSFDWVADTFRQYGLGEIAAEVERLAVAGFEGPALMLELEKTAAYQTRFAGNEERRRKGLQVLSPAEYLQLEDTYRQAFAAYQLGDQWSERSRLADLIAKDISPQELVQRINLAGAAAASVDPFVRSSLRDYYGIGEADLMEYFLDEAQGTQLLAKRAAAADLGAAAAAAKLQIDRQDAEYLQESGISREQLQQALGDNDTLAERAIASRFGETLTAQEIVKSEVGLDSGALNKRKRLASQERSLFQRGGDVVGGSRAAGSY